MDKLTDSNSRRRKSKSRDFNGSPLAGMFNNSKINKDAEKSEENNLMTVKSETKKNDDNDASYNTTSDSNKATPAPEAVLEKNIQSLPRKKVEIKPVGINQKDDEFELTRGADGKYKLSQNTIYKKVKNIPRTLSIREDVMLIVDELSKNGSKSYTRGVKSTIVSNGIMRELYEMGVISKTDLKRELRPYE